VGKLFIPFWDPSGGLALFGNQIMFLLAGMHPDNGMEIVKQSPTNLTFRMKNVDLSFKNGPVYGVSYEQFLEFSFGTLNELAKFMKLEFNHAVVDIDWYEITLVSK
jgi:hypothetical protein